VCFNKPTDYERWLDWNHSRFTEFMVILFGEDQTKLDLHANIIKFNFGLNDKDHLGDIRNAYFEQKVLFELSQLLENDFNPEHKTEAGQLELVTPNNSIMLAMNKVQPPAKTPKEFFTKFLRVRAEIRAIWHSDNDLGFFNSNSYGLSSNQSFSPQNTDSSQSASQQKRQKRDDNFREKKPFTIETCWTCGIKGHSRAECNKTAHPDRNQENVPFAQSAIDKRWAAQFPSRPNLDTTRRLDGPLVAPNHHAGTGKRIS
jgi:hypothetical protein